MNLADLPGLMELLLETTVAASAALLLVLLLRRPLRRAFGATVAYAAWALVPAAVIAVLLPAATVMSTPVAVTMRAAAVPMAVVQVAAPFDYMPWLRVAWLAGVVVMVLHLGRQQRAFRRGLGRLRPRADGLQQAESVAGLPAALGLWRPAIVVPADFDTRYSFEERELMRAHERSHIVRGDLQVNALVATLRSVFWFNPLLHHAARHFRHDQELACDQRVIARHPHGRRAYGEAMFKTQLAAQQPLPLGCHWGAFDKARSHPLKERIAMLKQPVPTVARWLGGSALVLTLAIGVGFAAWSAQPKRELFAASQLPAGKVMAQVEMRIDGGKPQQFTMISQAGEPFAMRSEHAGQQWEMQATASPRGDGMIVVDATLSRDGKLVGSPKLVVRDGAKAAIGIGEKNAGSGAFEGIELQMLLTAAAPPVPPAPPAPPAAMEAPSPPSPPSPPALPQAGIAPLSPLPAVAPIPPPPGRSKARIAPPAPRNVNRPRPSLPPAPDMPEAPVAPKNPNAAAQGVGGNVLLRVDVGADGRPRNVEVEDTQLSARFNETAVSIVRNWTFTPALKDGRNVAGQVRVPFVFEDFESMSGRGAGVPCDVALSLGPSGPHYCGRGR